ncbi:MAG: hypothetical protein PHP64_01355 [Actinomycetota bacterium]|nr:hypothetical protein [Actinomycetota bacterium]
MSIVDLSSFTSKLGITTAVWLYEDADTYVVQHDFLHMSFFKDDFKEFVDTLIVALRQVERMESPTSHLHPVVIRNPRSPEEPSYGDESESSNRRL